MKKRYKIIGVSHFTTEDSQNEESFEYIGDAHTVDEELRCGPNAVLSVILDAIPKGYNDFEIVVRGRKNKGVE